MLVSHRREDLMYTVGRRIEICHHLAMGAVTMLLGSEVHNLKKKVDGENRRANAQWVNIQS